MLRSQALAAVVAGGAFAGNQDASRWRSSAPRGSGLLAAKEGHPRPAVEQSAVMQETVETRQGAQRMSERETLDLARTKIVATDPLEAASTYQTLETSSRRSTPSPRGSRTLRFLDFMR